MIAVPIALLLIFTLLHLAFGSLREAFMVYTAIPLSAVGGIWLLWLRDLPFSISAGVGFIALFGIAVLNGIVLIEHFKELRKQGVQDIRELIIRGTSERLRPVLLTASAAAMGFLPMAISTSAGAEVQRPLATVVVGGLITATLLTMIVLPVLFCLFESPRRRRKKIILPKPGVMLIILLFLFPALSAHSQQLSLDNAIEIAVKNNAGVKAASFELESSQWMKKAAFNPGKTMVYYNIDQNNIAESNMPLKVWGLQQSIEFPGVYTAQRKEAGFNSEISGYLLDREINSIVKEVKKAYFEIVYLNLVKQEYQILDSNYTAIAEAARRNFELGGTGKLDYLSATAKQQETSLQLNQTENEISAAKTRLKALLQSDSAFSIESTIYKPTELLTNNQMISAAKQFYELNTKAAESQARVERYKGYPDLHLEYFLGSDQGLESKVYNGFQIGLGIPLWFPEKRAAAKSKFLQSKAIQQQGINQMVLIESKREQLMQELAGKKMQLDYYTGKGLELANEIRNAANLSFESGVINSFQYLQAIENAIRMKMDYLHSLHAHNLTVIEINHLAF
jgi:cobalt-zinc-cadmium resistance protein CzcA